MVRQDGGVTPASSRTRRLPGLLTGSMIRASTSCRNTSPPPGSSSNPSTVPAIEGVDQVAHPRGGDRQRTAARGPQPQVKLQLPRRDPMQRRRHQRLQLRLVVRQPGF